MIGDELGFVRAKKKHNELSNCYESCVRLSNNAKYLMNE